MPFPYTLGNAASAKIYSIRGLKTAHFCSILPRISLPKTAINKPRPTSLSRSASLCGPSWEITPRDSQSGQWSKRELQTAWPHERHSYRSRPSLSLPSAALRSKPAFAHQHARFLALQSSLLLFVPEASPFRTQQMSQLIASSSALLLSSYLSPL